MAHSNQPHLDAIVELAESIARSSPDCADRAMQIVRLVGDLDSTAPDAADVEDAIDAGTDGDLSDAQLRNAASLVRRAMQPR